MNTKIIITAIATVFAFLVGLDGGFVPALVLACIICGITYFIMVIWENRHPTKEPDSDTQDTLTIAEWENNDLNRFKSMPREVAAAYARQKKMKN